MKRLLYLLTFLSLSVAASNDALLPDIQPELGIAPIEIEEPKKGDEEITLDLPDYNEDTIAKKIEINKKHRHKDLKYGKRRTIKNM